MEASERGNVAALRWRAFSVPKSGAEPEEYEDAFAFSAEASVAAGAPFRAAVADGATEAAFAGRWAQLLVEAFVAHGAGVMGRPLPGVQRRWAAAVEEQVATLPWYAEAKAEAGAFAALLGLTLRRAEGPEGPWQALSVGDCNLFHLRGRRLLEAWPRANAADFDTRPALVPSRAEAPAGLHAEGQWQSGDAFVLASDAAAAWLVSTALAEALAWKDQDAFSEAVERGRAAGRLKNDDTTVAVVEVE